jgi:CRISPR-associated endonuclease/helicase Cas3
LNKLSQAVKKLWAKKLANNETLSWLPLVDHLSDSAFVAQKLWCDWLPESVKKVISEGVSGPGSAEQLFVFLAAIHDLGKATPVFQAKRSWPPCRDLDDQLTDELYSAGLPIKPYHEFTRSAKTPHALAAQLLLENAGCSRNIASIIGAHHGKPPDNYIVSSGGIEVYSLNYHLGVEGREAWATAQKELIDFACELAGVTSVRKLPSPDMASQVILSGLLIMADWLASNEVLFPYVALMDEPVSINREKRQNAAWKMLALPYPWEAGNAWMNSNLYGERFTFIKEPNELQNIALQTVADLEDPGIVIIEAPMGKGKTETALVCAEIIADKSNCGGVYFALPTQATTDSMFPRLLAWVNSLDYGAGQTIRLAHGKAQFNDDYQVLKHFEGSANIGLDEQSSVFVHEWFEGQKKSMLADFVVGTIDQLLLSALKQKHLMLRHLGLAGKVVIIDECHAYDAYMSQYLNRALSWLGAYRVPVIVLSATLPIHKRRALIDAYLNKDTTLKLKSDPLGKGLRKQGDEQLPSWVQNRGYPLITYTDKGLVHQKTVPTGGTALDVGISHITDEAIAGHIDEFISEGGCVGVVVNTVKRAQEIASTLRSKFGDEAVKLLHSRFLAEDRAEKEKLLLSELGKPGKNTNRPFMSIVVGTQVLEQSLDIDFDVLFTDICPMDLLLQRIGRLHRHRRSRPVKIKKASCLIMDCADEGFEAGAESIYGRYLLMRTKALLPNTIKLPHDIPALVQDTYDDSRALDPEPPGYQEAKERYLTLIDDKEKRAKVFRIGPLWPDTDQNMVGWLDTDLSEQQGEAAVRDTDSSIEVLLVQRKSPGSMHFLPWVGGGCEIALHEPPDYLQAKAISRQRIRLPGVLCAPWMIDRTINELEKINSNMFAEWQKSIWLKGELVLALDEKFTANLCGYSLTYDRYDGLLHEKEVKADE